MPAAHNKESEDLECWQEKLPQPKRSTKWKCPLQTRSRCNKAGGKIQDTEEDTQAKSSKQASKQPGPAQPSPKQPGSGVASERTQWLPFIRKYLYVSTECTGSHFFPCASSGMSSRALQSMPFVRQRSITTLAWQRTANSKRNNRKGQQVFHVYLFCPICP